MRKSLYFCILLFFIRMKRNKVYLIALAALTVLAGCSNDSDNIGNGSSNEININRNVVTDNLPSEVTRLEFPKLKNGNNYVIVHYAKEPGGTNKDVNYAVEWDTKKKANRWTCYIMTTNNQQDIVKRKPYTSTADQYPQDPNLPNSYRFSTDPFRGSGYDHGHLCPSADRLYSRDANDQTFYLTNMIPQPHDFNAGMWEKMEAEVRRLLEKQVSFDLSHYKVDKDTLFVVKGGTMDKSDQIARTLSNGLIVPKYNYCALLMKCHDGYMAMGFWFDQTKNYSDSDKPENYIVNIDELESLTGIDFFCNLPDEIENRIERLPRENLKRIWGY